jgi:aminoglycoside phosphotransferase (APT) family kinase protein
MDELSLMSCPLRVLPHSWLASVRALAALHSTPLDSLGLSEFSSSKEYFPRQIKTWSRVSAAQSTIVDVESQKPVGKIPSFDDLVAWYQRHLPDESKTGRCIVHGDYKLDNLMFHPTENRVIGILDWELCTTGSPVGHRAPYSDLRLNKCACKSLQI